MNTVWIVKITDPDGVLDTMCVYASRQLADACAATAANLFAADNAIHEDEIRGRITFEHTIYMVRSQCFEARKYPVFGDLSQNGTGA